MQTLKLFDDNAYAKECAARVVFAYPDAIVLDQTVFYPEGGGQIGDTGLLQMIDGREILVTNTRKQDLELGGGAIFHYLGGTLSAGDIPLVGSMVQCRLDWERRYRIMKMHTAAHLMCAILPYAVNGCHITDGSARIDFVTNDAFDKEQIEQTLNALIASGCEVQSLKVSSNDVKNNTALVRTINSLPPLEDDQVRMVKIGDLDIQPCGGTHVKSISELGRICVIKTKKVSATCRRIVLGLNNT